MCRNANIGDLEFIYNLIIDGSKNKNFVEEYYKNSDAARGLKIELLSILTNKIRVNGNIAYGIIYEHQGKPIGFVIMSSIDKNKGNEIYMASIEYAFRGKGFGKKMLNEITKQVEGKNLVLLARCNEYSESMYQILLKLGFEHIQTGKEGYRILNFTL
jgi:RimJ/RimL family protein N-acetyltransferase